MTSVASRSGQILISLVFLLSLEPLALRGQDYQRVAPNVPPRSRIPVLVAPVEPLPQSALPTRVLLASLRGLVFLDEPGKMVAAGVPAPVAGSARVATGGVKELDDARFTAQLEPFIGQPVTLADLNRIKELTAAWMRAHGRPFVDVSVPPQNVASGMVQVVVTQYKLSRVAVKGARFFSPSLIEHTSGLQAGQTLQLDRLQSDLDRLNRNPFLNVDAVFQPGSETGQTEVTLNARDRLPLRFYSGYDNLGVRSLGVEEFNAGVNWGNAFGTGQILSYQYTQSVSGRYTSHSISDTIPLRWGGQLLIFGSYGQQLPLMEKIFHSIGHSGQASVRYVHALPRVRRFTQDVEIGYDFKTTDNNLEFAGFKIFSGQAEVDQFPLIYDGTLTDRFGQIALQDTLVFSPGRLTPNNNTAALAMLVPGSRANYLYNRFLVTRTTPLPRGFTSVSRLTVQASQCNLPYSEQAGGGGVGSVRGYYTDTAFGSEGTLASQEMRLPPFSASRLWNRETESRDKTQFGVFFDYAHLRQVTPIPDIQSRVDLASAGLLARYSITRYLDVEYDLGWRLRSAPTVPQRGAYGQVSLTGSF